MFSAWELELIECGYCSPQEVDNIQALKEIVKRPDCDLIRLFHLQKQIQMLEGGEDA